MQVGIKQKREYIIQTAKELQDALNIRLSPEEQQQITEDFLREEYALEPEAPRIFEEFSTFIRTSPYSDMTQQEREDFIQFEVAVYPPRLQKLLLDLYQRVIQRQRDINTQTITKIQAAYRRYKERVLARATKENPEISAQEVQKLEQQIDAQCEDKIRDIVQTPV